VVRQCLATPSAAERIEAEHDVEHSHSRRDRLGRYVPDLAALRTRKRLFPTLIPHSCFVTGGPCAEISRT
jgi:hypothetical protein